MKRSDWLSGRKSSINFCIQCGDFAGDISELCIGCLANNKISATEALLAQALQTPGALNTIAQAMVNPIRSPLDYQGIARRFVRVEPIDEGNDGAE